jgi:capsular exopolysaccharide synthesis family protein
MDPLEYLRALRRRWAILVGTLLIAVVVAFSTTTVIPVGPPTRSYQAVTVILNTGQLNVPGISTLETVAALTTVGDVPERVAKRLNFEGDPLVLASRVHAIAEAGTGILRIVVAGEDPRETEEVADAFAEEVIGFLQNRKAETIAEQARIVSKRMEELKAETDELDRQIERAPLREATFLQKTLEAKIEIYGVLTQQYNGLVFSAADPGTLIIVQKASAQELAQGGFQPPSSRSGRIVFAAILGLIAGVGIVLLMERIDTRIQTREEAERHFGLPVLAEIPSVGRGRRAIATVSEPTSPPADAFRLLAASLSMQPSPNGETKRAPAISPKDRTRSILVTSAADREGKTSVVANLSAAFSQIGKRVLVLSCDFRHPEVHEFLGVRNGVGLADLLRKRVDGQPLLPKSLRPTLVPGVQLVPSGSTPPNPSTLLTTRTMRRVLDEARGQADVVLLDTPAILRASDAAHLAGQVDGLLVVARAGMTTVDQARRMRELLKRLDAPVLGVALNEATGVGRRGLRLSSFLGAHGDRGISQLARLFRREESVK